MARIKSLTIVSAVLVCGIVLGITMFISQPESRTTFVQRQRSTLFGPQHPTRAPHHGNAASSGVVEPVHGIATNGTREGDEGPSCKRLWKKGRSAWFDQRFIDDLLPVWMKENMELSSEVAKWWLSLQSSVNRDYQGELRKAFEVIPNPERFLARNLSSCLRCALVGNSGNLLGSGYGELIDSHDVVIRINEAMTRGFEKDVGRKETHRMMYPESFRDIPPETNFILLNFKVLDVAWTRTALTTGEIKKTYRPVRPKIKVPPSKVLFYNPALMWHIHHDWIDRKGRYPSSGALGVFFALQFCDELNVFGLGANAKGYWDHYWQPDDGAHNSAFLKTHVHDSQHEIDVIHRLADENIITFYKGVR